MALKIAQVELHYKRKRNLKPAITSPKDSYKVFLETWDKGTIDYVETTKVMLMDIANRCLGVLELSKGTPYHSLFDAKMMMQAILLANADRIILAHNHPSGVLLPSIDDDKLTEIAFKACKLFNVRLVDHLIISKDKYYSYAKKKRIKQLMETGSLVNDEDRKDNDK